MLWHAVTLAADSAAPSVGSEVPTFALRGTVVDESGAPVPKAKVVTSAGRHPDVNLAAVTDAAGNFTLPLSTWQIQAILVAKDETGSRIGSLKYVPGKTRPAARIVLHAARTIPVSVVDGTGRSIAGAKVGVIFAPRNGDVIYDKTRQDLLRERTDARGQAVLRLPADAHLECVWTVKAGAGFDYVLYRTPLVQRRLTKRLPPDPAKRAAEDSRAIKFVLGGVHKMRVHLVDDRRRPLPGVRVRVIYLEWPNRGGGVTVSAIDELIVVSDRLGIAEFDAIPAETTSPVYFGTATMGYFAYERSTFNPAEAVTDVTVVATRLPVLRIQVTYPDGRPALGAHVLYTARNYGASGGFTIGDLSAYPVGERDVHSFRGDAYCVVSATIRGFASGMTARVARMGEPLRPVHLVLQPAARVHGTLTVGKDRRPAANESVALIERDDDNYSKLPEDERLPRTLPPAERTHVTMEIPFHATTDAQGRFEFDAAPGRYVIGAGWVYLNNLVKATDLKDLFPDGAHEFEIKDQKEIAIDLHSDVPPSARKRPSRLRPAAGTKTGS
ncbi:MAG TPA: carboxypeptidase-like regulatory domain-containing protein [Planctomycetaceae bacterium]|nr:carboxypeptidase-like regulatory domain-containing protein [Planctomycetaceae bacterium]